MAAMQSAPVGGEAVVVVVVVVVVEAGGEVVVDGGRVDVVVVGGGRVSVVVGRIVVVVGVGRVSVVGDTTAVPLPHETAANTTAVHALLTAPVHHTVTATVGRPDLALLLS
jgi:hypothetical protein